MGFIIARGFMEPSCFSAVTESNVLEALGSKARLGGFRSFYILPITIFEMIETHSHDCRMPEFIYACWIGGG